MPRTPGRLVVADHPLVRHLVTRLRDRRTEAREVRSLVDGLAALLAYEATRDLPLRTVSVETPLEPASGEVLREEGIAVVPILRAGLAMVDAVLRLFPRAPVGHVGLYRDETRLEPVRYYLQVPGGLEDRETLVVDPMLATGGSATEAVRLLKGRGARSLRFLCCVATPAGIEAFSTAHPDVPVHAAALDRELSREGYILPGVGDVGDRLYGTG